MRWNVGGGSGVGGWWMIQFLSVHSIDNLGDRQTDIQTDKQKLATGQRNTSYFMVKLMCKYETKWCFSTPT